ncbi:MAG TPA: TonB-dependent receptor [Terriglobales bacterium]|nr:TonB-dependent receptor [Terriglobales bacterium]
MISRVLVLLAAMLVVCSSAFANVSRITGVVTDSTGAAIPNAHVTLRTGNGRTVASTNTGGDGAYSLTAAPGVYALEVQGQSFGRAVQSVTLRGEPAVVNVSLRADEVITSVSVTAEVGQVSELDRLAQRVNVLSEIQLAERAKTGLAQVAQEEPGLTQQRTSPTISSILVRGSNDVAVYIDGVRWTQSTQRGGISTFFNLNDPALFSSVEVLRGPGSAQYGSDSLAGTIHLQSKNPVTGSDPARIGGNFSTFYGTADHSFGSTADLSYGGERYGVITSLTGRRHNRMRPGGGYDTHAAVTRFLGLPSTIFGERLPDTAFTQYSGLINAAAAPTADQQIMFRYQRGQQDGARRYDQLLGGDGNLIADLRNMMLDFGYLKYQKQNLGWFDHGSIAVSYNSQREQRINQGGQGNPNAAIISDTERTTTWGMNFLLDKVVVNKHATLIGADIYRDRVTAPSFSTDPTMGTVTPVRPRVPNGATFLQYGFFAQDSFDLLADRLRLNGALRYNIASYRSEARFAPVVNGSPLFPDDSLRVSDFSGRAGAVATLTPGVNLAFQYSRGFRAPNITALGSVGLVGVGYQVAANELRGHDAFVGSTADASAVSTGQPVTPLASEHTNNFDASLSIRRGPLQASLGGFFQHYANTISRQTLILPQGALGSMLGSQPITQQLPSGAVFVPLSSAPVLVQVNFGESRVRGLESALKYRFSSQWSASANYTYLYAEGKNGEPPNTETGTLPPQTLNLEARYEPSPRIWFEAYGVLAGRQDRLSSLGLSDRRTGAARTRTQIQNFFRRGATVRGLVSPGADSVFGNADDILIATGETLAQVQNRVLGPGVSSAPLFTYLPGYGWFGIRAGVQVSERTRLVLDFENIADKNYRNAAWGMPGSGRNLFLRYTMAF